jgi:hypothetical protein
VLGGSNPRCVGESRGDSSLRSRTETADQESDELFHIASPEDVARVIGYLASDDARIATSARSLGRAGSR